EQLALEPVARAALPPAGPHVTLCNHVDHSLAVGRRAADDVEHLAGRVLVLKSLSQLFPRLCHLSCESGNLLLEFGGRYASGRRFAGLQPCRALALHRLSVTTASLHVAPAAVHGDA